jgi:hypothetical protein
MYQRCWFVQPKDETARETRQAVEPQEQRVVDEFDWNCRIESRQPPHTTAKQTTAQPSTTTTTTTTTITTTAIQTLPPSPQNNEPTHVQKTTLHRKELATYHTGPGMLNGWTIT